MGYDVDEDGFLIPNEKELRDCGRVLEMRELDPNASFRSMAKILNIEGRDKKGIPWEWSDVRNVWNKAQKPTWEFFPEDALNARARERLEEDL